MYCIEFKSMKIINSYENIENMLISLNEILSKLYDENNVPIDIEVIGNKIVYKSNDNIITSNIIPYNIQYLQYLTLHKNNLAGNFNIEASEYLLNIFTYKKCLMDPYIVLLNIFKINEELIYQTFILFLNKTIFNNHTINQLDLNNIFGDFFINHSAINHKKYNRLFTYFLSAKEIYPFMINYEKHISIFDIS